MITHNFVFLNYLLGMNFATSIAYINGDSGARECCVFSRLNDRNPPPTEWWTSWPLPKAIALAACRGQPTHLSVLVDWLGDPMGVSISSELYRMDQ